VEDRGREEEVVISQLYICILPS